MNRTAADAMGMLATVINSIALKEFCQGHDIPATVMSATAMDKIADSYTPEKAISLLTSGQVVIIAGGTGNPFFTTDTAAALRCAEIKAEVLLKATKVDGIYDSDPMKNADAKKFTTITHQEALSKNLRVMDSTAFSFCMDNAIPIIIFKLSEKGNLRKCVAGDDIGSTISQGV